MKKIFELINRNIFSEKFGDLFGRKKLLVNQLPIITISREMGSGGRPIAYLVERRLGSSWKVFHGEIVDELVKQSHLEKKLIEEIDERAMPVIDEFIADFFGKRYLNLSSYYRHLVKILSTIGARGNAIIVGRGAQYLFPHALKVRIICEMDTRIKWLMRYEKLTKTEAVKRIDASDNKRIDFEQVVFRHDPRKAHHYDLVIRTGPRLSIENAAELITFAAKKRFKL